MDNFSFIGNNDAEAIEHLYRQYKSDPDSINKTWTDFFKGFDFALANYAQNGQASEIFDKEFKVINLIQAYRKRGHLFTTTNPVRTRRKYYPSLDLKNYELNEDDLDTSFYAGKEIGIGKASLRKIVDHLKQTYCRSIGVEYMFIRNPEKTTWLKTRMEKEKNTPAFTPEQQKNIYFHLMQSVGFESFIHKKFTGQKRFSLEGAESLIPALHALINKGAELGINEYIIGMAHRGRLNVLANLLQKPFEYLFKEFEAEAFEDRISLGDVKYHLGYGNTVTTSTGKKVRLNLAPNPSHLEAVTPLIEGIARAKIEHKYNHHYNKLAPVIIHGDAAIAGQGVIYEVVQMAGLEGYKTGGTIHLVINNQVGFTTSYLEGRSSTYCTDIGKVTKAPIFHVNGDDVEALVYVIRLAMEYRQKFESDVFIDLLCYRKYGHNEGDEPRFTHPTLYQIIANHPNPRDFYSKKLVERKVFSEKDLLQAQKDYDEILEDKFAKAKKIKKLKIKQFLEEDWKNYRYVVDEDIYESPKTGVKIKNLIKLGDKINYAPENKKFFRKLYKMIEARRKMISDNALDWGMAELLAYGSLLLEGHPVRISGQDSVRGTFSHRHASLTVEDKTERYTPLQHISAEQAPFSIYNSPLNEYGTLGFEYGYALSLPNGLTVWEAQFGDFNNVAQVIIDQYISSAEEKWGIMNGIVLYLPHGYEGQGPEHSSARIERWLDLSARNNMQIVNCTTPANFFHVLRRQMHRNYRTPLIIFTPKSLLRQAKCISTLENLQNDTFFEVIDDKQVDTSEVRRVVFCSGKIYYDLLEKKEEYNARDIALIRIEQLHPFPRNKVEAILKKYKNAILHIWVQEEPYNMGAWTYAQHHFKDIQLIPVTRQPSGSTAVGLHQLHLLEQEQIIYKIFRKCNCERHNKYCGLQCVVGKSWKEVLKQHQYFDQI